jgi:hypothetical protein
VGYSSETNATAILHSVSGDPAVREVVAIAFQSAIWRTDMGDIRPAFSWVALIV